MSVTFFDPVASTPIKEIVDNYIEFVGDARNLGVKSFFLEICAQAHTGSNGTQ